MLSAAPHFRPGALGAGNCHRFRDEQFEAETDALVDHGEYGFLDLSCRVALPSGMMRQKRPYR